MKRIVFGAALASVLGVAAAGRGADRTFDEQTLKAAGQGRAIYLLNCTGCHGVDARGSLATASHTQAPDLTLIAVRDGHFDRNHVKLHIDGRFMDRQGEMPRWGKVFAQGRPGKQGWADTRVYALARYLDVIQEPEAVSH
jgi:mono/diheme cytochrome c family protein